MSFVKNVLIALHALASLVLAVGSASADNPTQITTPAGKITVREERGRICGEYLTICQVARVNRAVIAANFHVGIDRVFPSEKEPRLVVISSGHGGNCCAPDQLIFDVSSSRFIRVETKTSLGAPKFFATENGVLIEGYDGLDRLGDNLLSVYRYVWGAGKASFVTKSPVYSTTPIYAKSGPWDVLDDPIVREPLLRLLGEANFAPFRFKTQVSSLGNVKIYEDRFIVADGCAPHSCDSQLAMFVIDNVKKVAWAVEIEKTSARTPGTLNVRLWGDLKRDDSVAVKSIGEWLAMQKVSWTQVSLAPISPKLTQTYEDARKPDAAIFVPDSFVEMSGKAGMPNRARPNETVQMSAVDLFKTVSPSVFVVKGIRAGGGSLQGSAVAVSSRILVTNCHVVDGVQRIELSQKGEAYAAILISRNVKADRCVLQADKDLRSFVPVRSYQDVLVGERVFSIGAPLGLELTLSDGLVSGKRSLADNRLLQTTAPISPGSSGGGLFDAFGNLIGVTTFLLKDSQNLNFAIAGEDFIQ